MGHVKFTRHDLSPSDLSKILAAERVGLPFVAVRGLDGSLELMELEGSRVCVGRDGENDLVLAWDVEVSRVHALFEQLAGSWTVVDDDLSRNGTFVNGHRVRGRRRLDDRDVVRVGATHILFRNPSAKAGETSPVSGQAEVAAITPGQRRVLVALCRPFLDSAELGVSPPSNSELGKSLDVSTEAVRSQLKLLFKLFEVPDLPQNRKRAELARRALASGVVLPRDLNADP